MMKKQAVIVYLTNHCSTVRIELFSWCDDVHRGLLPTEKCELQRVMEQRRLEQQREREQALRPLTDLEQELSKRRQRLLTVKRLFMECEPIRASSVDVLIVTLTRENQSFCYNPYSSVPRIRSRPFRLPLIRTHVI